MSAEIEAILLDMDGTILDSESAALKVVSETLSTRLGRTLEEHEIQLFRENHWYDALSHILPGKEQELYDAIAKRLYGYIEPTSYPKVKETLLTIQSRGITLGIVSSLSHNSILHSVGSLGISSLFSVVVGGDDTTSGKPDPEPLKKAASLINLSPSSCVYIGDQPGDIAAAKAAGMKSAAALWGKGNRSLISLNPDFVLEKPSDMEIFC